VEWINNPNIAPLRPYLKIMRLDNVTGTFLLLWPCLISLGFVSDANTHWSVFVVFTIGAIVMRSAGCIVNDIIDRKYDAQVKRTKDRPLANGDLKIYEALLLLFLLLTIAGIILTTLSKTSILLGLVIIPPIFIYPFMKRITYWPQIFLALTINWGVLIGWAAVMDGITISAILVYLGCVFWTLGYDTIYAHQDKEDDILIGIKSTALKFDVYTKKYLYFFYLTTIILFWIVGILQGSGILFHVLLLLGAFQLYWQSNTVELDNADDCMRKFSSNRYFGMLIFTGVMLGKIAI
jgi:4-hydroxybenzoate polyprenyltransferase